MKKIICIAGLIGSGKDEAAKYIEEKYGYHVIDYANILREICRRDGLEVTRENLQNTRVKYGNTFLAEIAIKKIQECGKDRIILTPMRRSEDFAIPKKEFGHAMKMIVVQAPQETRFERLKSRGRENDPKDFLTFQRQERREFEIFNFDRTFSMADYEVDNSGTLEELHSQIDDIMASIEGSRKIRMIIMGPQGSGKGTHAKKLAAKLGLLHISTGDLLREIAAQNDEEGREMKNLLSSGVLLSDEKMFSILKKRMDEAKAGFILDGWPRTLNQAELTDTLTHIDKVLYLNVTDKECLRRLGGRAQCEKCGAIYGNENPPKERGKCDACKGQLYIRDDDKEETIRKRLAVYHEQTEPILEFYRKKSILHEVVIDRIMDPEEVFENICAKLLV